MRFYELLNKLFFNSHKPDKGLYVLEIFSALCGETNPFKANNASPFSSCLPDGLRGGDSTHRKRLYNYNHGKLTRPIKKCIREHGNKDTFIAYLEKSVSSELFPELCIAFEISYDVSRPIMFESIYDQFLKFAYSQNDDTKNIVAQMVMERISASMNEIPISIPDNKKEKVVPHDKHQPEQIYKIFEQNIQGFNIIGFIDSNLVNSLAPYLVEDAKQFIGCIKHIQRRDGILEKNKEINQEIIIFSDMLYKYVKYLKRHMKMIRTFDDENSNCFHERYEPPKDDNGEFKKKTDRYKNELHSSYDKICKYGVACAINNARTTPENIAEMVNVFNDAIPRYGIEKILNSASTCKNFDDEKLISDMNQFVEDIKSHIINVFNPFIFKSSEDEFKYTQIENFVSSIEEHIKYLLLKYQGQIEDSEYKMEIDNNRKKMKFLYDEITDNNE